MQIFSSIPYIAWLILSVACFAVGEYFSKKFGLEPGWVYLALVVASSVTAALFWLPAITQNNQLSIVGVMWSVMSLMATVLLGIIVFGEHLNGLALLGILLGFVSVVLLSIA